MSKNILYGEIVDGELKFDNKDDWDRLFKIYSGQSIEISVQPLGKIQDPSSVFAFEL